MPVDGGDGQHGVGQKALEDVVQLVKETFGCFDVVFLDDRDQPFQIDAVAENFFVGRFKNNCSDP